jgi:hypothetical protein
MTAKGHLQTSPDDRQASGLPPRADLETASHDVGCGPEAEVPDLLGKVSVTVCFSSVKLKGTAQKFLCLLDSGEFTGALKSDSASGVASHRYRSSAADRSFASVIPPARALV